MPCACETVELRGRLYVTRVDPDCRRHGLPEGYAAHPPLRRHARPGEDDRTVEQRLYLEATSLGGGQGVSTLRSPNHGGFDPAIPFDHVWFWRARLPERKGQSCRVLARGTLNSALVEFGDGYRTVTSRYAVRKAAG